MSLISNHVSTDVQDGALKDKAYGFLPAFVKMVTGDR